MSFTIGSTIYSKLAADATLTGYIGTSPVRIFPDVAPLNIAQTFPYITYNIISQTPTNTKGPQDDGNPVVGGTPNQRSPLDIVRIQISSFSTDYSTGVTIANRIRTILDRGIGSGFVVGSGPTIDSIIYDGMSTDYEHKIKPQGVYNFTQEYIVRIINTDFAPAFANVYSIQFDGVDDYLTVGDQSIFSFGNGTTDSAFSMSFWIRPASISGGTLFGKSSSSSIQEYQCRFSSGGDLRFRCADASASSYIQSELTNPLSISTWYHIVCTYDGSGIATGIKIYVDAVTPAQSTTTSGTYVAMENTAAPLNFGFMGLGASYYNGHIDEMSLFDIELSASQVLAIYNGGSPTDLESHTGLIGWWRMGDSGAYPVVNDNSSNTNNATMTNMAANDIQNIVP
tara:strand:- start:4841 stop:6031 length:1191 start_codon:yes stop_codon:yes gene_type:complete